MGLIKCPECGKEISNRATLCPSCGFPVADDLKEKELNSVVCPFCGTMNTKSDDYCNECGIRLTSYKQNVAKSKKEYVEFEKSEYRHKGLIGYNKWKNENQEFIDKKKADEEELIAKYKREKIPFCPSCHSTSITYINKKLSVGRALVGGVIAGTAGAILGGQSGNGGRCKCLNCGRIWRK